MLSYSKQWINLPFKIGHTVFLASGVPNSGILYTRLLSEMCFAPMEVDCMVN